MRRPWSVAAVLLLAAAPARARLEVSNVQAAYGPLASPRPALTYGPGEVVFFRFLVRGGTLNEYNQVSAQTKVQLVDDHGQVVDSRDMPPVSRWVGVPGGSFLHFAAAMLGEQVPPGKYRFTATVRDSLSQEEATFSRSVEVRPAELAVGGVTFFADPEHKVLAGSTVHPLQPLHLAVPVRGYAHPEGKVHLTLSVRLLDPQGKELTTGKLDPPDLVVRQDVPPSLPPEASVGFSTSVVLFGPGDFTLRLTVTDRTTNRVATFETPLHVLTP
jgi:hypothetical protein